MVELDVPDLPEGFVVTNAYVVVEGLNPKYDDDKTLCVRCTEDMKPWVALGMLDAAQAIERSQTIKWFKAEGDDD